MRTEQIHTLAEGLALMLHPCQQPALVDLIPYTKLPYGRRVATERDAITALRDISARCPPDRQQPQLR